MSLQGKVAIVTGAASGIGFETVKAFLEAGAAGVTLVDLSSDALSRAVTDLAEIGEGRTLSFEADVSDEAAVSNYVEETVKTFGRLDISAQIAGVAQKQCPVDELSQDTFDQVMRVNVKGPFLGVKHSARVMKTSPSGGRGCSIILCGSQLGLDGQPLLAAYCASKFAVRGLTQTAAAELGPVGIRVNTVCPGPIETPMLSATPRDQWHKLSDKAMLERLGKPQEIASAILFLASDQSSYVTGSSLKVDGGWSRFA